MSSVDNNQFEVKPNPKSKRKITSPCPNVYLNPGLDLLANEDPMCNTAMEVVPVKKRKRSKSCDIAAFENACLDTGISRAAVNEFLARELNNVRKTMRQQTATDTEIVFTEETLETFTEDKENVAPHCVEPVYDDVTDMSMDGPGTIEQSLTLAKNEPQCMELSGFEPNMSEIEMDSGISGIEHKSIVAANSQASINDTVDSAVNVQKHVKNQVIINNTSNINLSFIDRLGLDSSNLSNQSLYLDDDLNESNIMEIKTITIITKKKRIIDKKKSTNPFLDPNLTDNFTEPVPNPFLTENISKPELEYNDVPMNRQVSEQVAQGSSLMPRRLFLGDTNSTISTVNESMNMECHEYENMDGYRSESPIYENIGEMGESYNKQSKILGHDVSRFSAIDIMNLNKQTESNVSNESTDSKRDLKHQILKASNKLSKKFLKTLKKTFKHDKAEQNTTLNPYEVPRKPPKQKSVPKDSGIENPALNLDNSDEIEIEEIDDDEEHQYETVKTLRNTQLNMNVTPLREKDLDNDLSQSKPYTPGKKVRFDSTLNQEKVITGNSFDYDIQSPGFDAKIDKYHDELENCINERKFIQQNM